MINLAAALLSALLFAAGNVLQKMGMLRKGSVFRWSLLWQPYWLLGMGLSGLAILLVYWVTARADLTLVQPLLALNPLFTVLLGAVFLKEHLAKLHYQALTLAFLGVVLLSLQSSAMGKGEFAHEYLFLFPLLGLMIYWWLFSKKRVEYRFALLGGMGFGLATVIYKIMAVKFLASGDLNLNNLKEVLLTLELPLYLFTYFGGTLWGQGALIRGQTSFVIPVIAAVATLVPILGGIVVFSEPAGVWRWAGLIAVMVSLYLFSLSSETSKGPSSSQE